MAGKWLELSDIAPPLAYIRDGSGGANEQHANDLRDMLLESEKEWPFDTHCIVAPLAKEEAVPLTMGGKSGKVHYRMVDGYHRGWASIKAKKKKVFCDVTTYATATDELIAQWTANQSGILKIDRQARAVFIKTLRDVPYPLTLGDIAKRVGLSEMSVSRILRDLQTTSRPHKGKGKKKKKKKGSPAGEMGTMATNGAFQPLEWFRGLVFLIQKFDEHKADVLKARGNMAPETIAAAYQMAETLVNAPAA